MAINKIETFTTELNLISNVDIRNWVSACVAIIPDYIFEIPASSTGKYHPVWSLGKEGLVRHIKAVTHLIPRFSRQYSLDALHESIATAAAILHDSLKYGFDFDYRYHKLHPYLPREFFKDVPFSFDMAIREKILVAIESHMGNVDGAWCYLPYVKPNVSRTQMVVHLADYTAADPNYVPTMFRDVNTGEFERTVYNMNPQELTNILDMYLAFDMTLHPGTMPPDARAILLPRVLKAANVAEAFAIAKAQVERLRG